MAGISRDDLLDWFDDYDIEDLTYVEKEGDGRSGYHISDYEDKGYYRTLIVENMAEPNQAVTAWEERALGDGFFQYHHLAFQEYAIEIDDDELWVYLPELPERWYLELKAVLAGGPPGTPNGERSPTTYSHAAVEIEDVFKWAEPEKP